MVKHIQTILSAVADHLSVFDHFVGLVLKGLTLETPSTLIYCFYFEL